MSLNRREFTSMGLIGVAEAAMARTTQSSGTAHAATHPSMADVPYEKKDPRIGFIGVGGRGTSLLKNMLAADGRVVAICDVVAEKAQHAQAMVTAAQKDNTPELYTAGDHDYERMLRRDDIDLVVIATPWIWHAPMAVFAMEHGKHVCVEVPGVRTLEECWSLVRTSEKTRKHCTMLENCCYGYNETLMLRMTQAGKLGELLWGEGAYLHDLRDELFGDKGEGLWRRKEHTLSNGNIYPTHGLGPVANYMDVNRGDYFDHIVSMSSRESGFSEYREAHVPKGDAKWQERYKEGDFNISLIRTRKGRVITVKHDVSNPTPYSRVNAIAGSKGLFEDYPPRIYLDGETPENWGSLDKFKQYESPVWSRIGDLAKRLGGHGGMDFVMLYRVLDNFRNGRAPDMDVYDAALWASVTPLSVASVAAGSAPQKFPEFLGSRWTGRERSAIGTMS